MKGSTIFRTTAPFVLLLGFSGGVGFSGAVRAPRASTLLATKCAPSVVGSKKHLAPGLRIVRVSGNKGTCKSSIAIIGGTGRDIWGANYNRGLWHSTDDLRTWRLVWQGSAGSHVERALRTASGHVLIEVADATSTRRIMRSRTQSARRFITTFILPSGSFLHFTTSWGQYSAVGGKQRTIYAAEYGDHPDPVHLWRSTNDGRSFVPVLSLPGRTSGSLDRIRHFHGVFLDPFTKWLWVAIGDNTPEPRIGYSRDGGRSFAWITRGDYPQSRAVGLVFAKNAVYWGTDVPERLGAFYRWDRSTGAITPQLSGLRAPFFDARQSRGWFVQFSEVSTKENDGYIGDDYVHVLVGNSLRVHDVQTPWKRDALHRQQKVAPLGLTWPDRSGCFWLSLPYLTRTDSTENFKLCLGD